MNVNTAAAAHELVGGKHFDRYSGEKSVGVVTRRRTHTSVGSI